MWLAAFEPLNFLPWFWPSRPTAEIPCAICSGEPGVSLEMGLLSAVAGLDEWNGKVRR